MSLMEDSPSPVLVLKDPTPSDLGDSSRIVHGMKLYQNYCSWCQNKLIMYDAHEDQSNNPTGDVLTHQFTLHTETKH